MVDYLKLEDMIFERDEQGDLLPVDLVVFPLEVKKFVDEKDDVGKVVGKKVVVVKQAPKIKVLPASRSKWLVILKMTPEEQDKEILFNHVLEPKITEKEYAVMKPTVVSAIVRAFTLLVLDISPTEETKNTKEELTEAEEFQIAKNSNVEKDE